MSWAPRRGPQTKRKRERRTSGSEGRRSIIRNTRGNWNESQIILSHLIKIVPSKGDPNYLSLIQLDICLGPLTFLNFLNLKVKYNWRKGNNNFKTQPFKKSFFLAIIWRFFIQEINFNTETGPLVDKGIWKAFALADSDLS